MLKFVLSNLNLVYPITLGDLECLSEFSRAYKWCSLLADLCATRFHAAVT